MFSLRIELKPDPQCGSGPGPIQNPEFLRSSISFDVDPSPEQGKISDNSIANLSSGIVSNTLPNLSIRTWNIVSPVCSFDCLFVSAVILYAVISSVRRPNSVRILKIILCSSVHSQNRIGSALLRRDWDPDGSIVQALGVRTTHRVRYVGA